MQYLNPNSLHQSKAYAEPFIKNAQHEESYQFQRIGYFTVDKASRGASLIFNKTVGLRDTWAKK